MEISVVIEDYDQLTTKSMYNYAKKVQKKVLQIVKQEYSHNTYMMFKEGLAQAPLINKEFEVIIFLNGWLPCAIEDGVDEYDMKPGLLASSHAKVSKSGSIYMRIPVVKTKKGNAKEFRTVSTKSKADSWIHPGFIARNLFEQAVNETEF